MDTTDRASGTPPSQAPDEQAEKFEFERNADDACAMIDSELDRDRLDALLTEAEQSALGATMDDAYFARLAAKIDNYAKS